MAGVAEYYPSKLVATEPNDETQRARDNLKALAELAPRFNTSIRQQDDFTAMEELRRERRQFGLVTNLNIFPYQIPYIDHFLNDAKEIVVRDGLIITSVAEEEYGQYLDDIKRKGVPGLKLDISKRKYGVAGTVILTAKKL